jgi:PDZ domain
VDSAGMVTIDGEKTNLNEVVERKFAGNKVSARFLRDGGWNDVEIELKPLPSSRMYSIQYEKKPRYIVFAGLVFQPLDTNLFATAKFDNVTVRRLYTDYVPKGLFEKHRDIVVLTRVENDPVNSRLGDFTGYAVDKINGVEVTDLKHAHALLHPEKPPEFHVIELFGASRPLIIPSAEVPKANERIAQNYDITQLENLEE